MAKLATMSRLTVKPLGKRIGCEIEVAREELLDGTHAEEIRSLLVEHGVLRFPAVQFTDEEQLTFARTLGPIAADWDVSADRTVNRNLVLAEYQRSSIHWHFDGFGSERPEFATMMSPRLLGTDGGAATEFASCYAAYEDLPPADKALIDGLQVHHSFETMMRMVRPWPSHSELLAWQSGGRPKKQPMVWHHRNGRNSLLLGGSAFLVEDMDPETGRALICRLNEWATQPQYVFRYQWQIGDLVIWDNSGTLHRAVPYASDSKRLMHRTTIASDEIPH